MKISLFAEFIFLHLQRSLTNKYTPHTKVEKLDNPNMLKKYEKYLSQQNLVSIVKSIIGTISCCTLVGYSIN